MVESWKLSPPERLCGGGIRTHEARRVAALVYEKPFVKQACLTRLFEWRSRLRVDIVQTAFKEWAVIVEALGQGEQILILRKGGMPRGEAGSGGA